MLLLLLLAFQAGPPAEASRTSPKLSTKRECRSDQADDEIVVCARSDEVDFAVFAHLAYRALPLVRRRFGRRCQPGRSCAPAGTRLSCSPLVHARSHGVDFAALANLADRARPLVRGLATWPMMCARRYGLDFAFRSNLADRARPLVRG